MQLLAELGTGIEQIRSQLSGALAVRPDGIEYGALVSLDLEQVLGETLRSAGSTTGADAASVAAVGPGGEVVTLADGFRPGEEEREPFWPPPPGRPRAVLLDYEERESPAIRSGLAVPIEADRTDEEGSASGPETIGLVSVFTRGETPFGEPQVAELRQLARQVGRSIDNAFRFRELHRRAVTDRPTSLHNQAYLEDALAAEVQRAERHRRPLALLTFDLDDFGELNARLGYAAADDVVAEVAKRVQGSNTRLTDVVCRARGGDEFAVLLPETTLEGAILFYQRLRDAIEAQPFARVESVSFSAGVAQLWTSETAGMFLERGNDTQQLTKLYGKGRLAASVEPAEAGERAGFTLWVVPEAQMLSGWSARATHLPPTLLGGAPEVVQVSYEQTQGGREVLRLIEHAAGDAGPTVPPPAAGVSEARITRDGTSLLLRSTTLGEDWLRRMGTSLAPVPRSTV